jgi:Uma2 family endonuclease
MTAMTVRTATALISADEFLSQDHPIGSELIDGAVYVNDPGFRHQRICRRLFAALDGWVRAHDDTGEAGWGGNWVLNDRNVYKPEVWWTATAPQGARHDGPPDLAVEVRSPGTWHRDVGRKLQRYREAGTKELWLVDTPASTVLVYRVEGFSEPVEVGPGTRLGSPLLPGFALPIDELFAE